MVKCHYLSTKPVKGEYGILLGALIPAGDALLLLGD